MKKILRFIFYVFFFILFWPFLLYKSFGNTKVKFNGNTVIIANHYSNFDPFLMKFLLLGKKIRFVATIDVKKRPIPRFVSWLCDCFYLGGGASDFSEFRRIFDYLNKGGNIVIFPEGLVNPTKYGFLDFKDGVAFIAKRTKADVLPVFIYPEFSFLKKTKFYIGDTIPYDEYSAYTGTTEITMYFLSKIMDLSAMNQKAEHPMDVPHG